MQKLIPALVAGACLAFAPAAGAATPFTIGNGNFPDVSVDSSGTAHIVWEQHDGGASGDNIGYCQVPKGNTACAPGRQTSLDSVAEGIGRSSYVFAPTPERIVIVSHRCCTPDATIAYVSSNAGSSFAEGVTIGDLDAEDGVLGGDDAFYGVDTGGRVQRMPLAGPQVKQQAILDAGFSVPTASSIAFFGGNRPVKASADGSNTTYSVFRGTGDPNDASNWDGPSPVTPPGGEPHLASSSAGTAMIYRLGSSGGGELHALRLDASGPTATLSDGDPIQADLTADPSGRFTAAWVENGIVPNEVRIATSSDGSNWSGATPILRGTRVDDLFHTQVATGSDGKGVAVFDANSRTGDITVVPLEPAGSEGLNEPQQTATVGDQELSFFGPTECVQPPERVTLRVTSRRKRRLSPRRRVKIASVVFSVDTIKKTDRKAAFRQSFSTAAFPRGSVHRVRAVVTLRPVVKGAFKNKMKTLKGRFNVCG
jgi:hypothetical protein